MPRSKHLITVAVAITLALTCSLQAFAQQDDEERMAPTPDSQPEPLSLDSEGPPKPIVRGRYQMRRNYALMIPGVAILASSYLVSAIGGGMEMSGIWAIPVVGPLVWVNSDAAQDGWFAPVAIGGAVLSALTQITGIALTVAGATTKSRVFVGNVGIGARL